MGSHWKRSLFLKHPMNLISRLSVDDLFTLYVCVCIYMFSALGFRLHPVKLTSFDTAIQKYISFADIFGRWIIGKVHFLLYYISPLGLFSFFPSLSLSLSVIVVTAVFSYSAPIPPPAERTQYMRLRFLARSLGKLLLKRYC